MKPIIVVTGIGKQYRIGKKAAYKTLRESLMSAVRRLFVSSGKETAQKPYGR
jgi:hypothetical protein